jgi:WD40 repeat protein
MKGFVLTNLWILVSVVLAATNLPFPAISMQQDTAKKAEIGYLFSVSNSQIGCSYYGLSHEDKAKINIFSIHDGKLIHSVLLNERESPDMIAASDDGDLIAVSYLIWKDRYALESYNIGCYSIQENRWLWKQKWADYLSYESGEDFIERVIFRSGGGKIVAIGIKTLVIYDARTGKVLEEWREPFRHYPVLRFGPTRTAFSPSGRYLVIWKEFHPIHLPQYLYRFRVNKEMTVWDIDEHKLVARWKKPQDQLCCAVFSPDEKEIIFGSAEGYIRIWSVSEKKVVREWEAHRGKEGYKKYPYSSYFRALIISQDGKYLATKGATATGDGFVVKIWDFVTGKLAHEIRDVSSGVVLGEPKMAFSPNGRYFAYAQNLYLWCLYDTQTWAEKWCVFSSS